MIFYERCAHSIGYAFIDLCFVQHLWSLVMPFGSVCCFNQTPTTNSRSFCKEEPTPKQLAHANDGFFWFRWRKWGRTMLGQHTHHPAHKCHRSSDVQCRTHVILFALDFNRPIWSNRNQTEDRWAAVALPLCNRMHVVRIKIRNVCFSCHWHYRG